MIFIDIETDGLDNPSKIHCIACVDKEGNEFLFTGDYSSFCSYVSKATKLVGHNIIDYDYRVISKLLSVDLPSDKIIDTLILSRLHHYKMEGGHSLENWGKILDHEKIGLDINDWSQFTPEIGRRCLNDAQLTRKIYQTLLPVFSRHGMAFASAIEVEHQMAFVCLGMELDGFRFDARRARVLRADLDDRVQALDKELLDAFPPKPRDDGVITPRLTKNGTISRTNMRWFKGNDWTNFAAGCPFTRLRWEPFNPGSPGQIVERLNEAGWKPTVKTDSGESWKVNEENLSTLPTTAPPAARKLVERIMLASRVRKLDEWLKLCSGTTGRVHGRFVGLGTYSHRMAHRKPNMGNVSAEKSIKYKGEYLRNEATRLGGDMRSLWIADSDGYLVGTDFDAAHLRIFAHLIDDKELIQALVSGNKEDGTDPHTVNQRKIGQLCTSRDLSKTCVYAFLNGGGAGKFASILGCDYRQGKAALDRFVASYPGLENLRTTQIPILARRGYFQGLDGRLVPCDSEHHMLACMLQNAEAVIMKHACILWRNKARELGLQFRQVNFVHDEFQTESFGSRENAEQLGCLQRDSIVEVGLRLGLRCPLAGNYKIGKNWLETH